MHLLYVDESGTPTDPNLSYFVLSGISIFERETHWVEQELNKIAARFNPIDPYAVELHGSPMRSGRGFWKSIPLELRIRAMEDALSVLAQRQGRIRIFASVVERSMMQADDPIFSCFEQIASRFDMYLKRLHQQGDTQRGLAIFDKSSTEKTIQNLARTFKYDGHTWGKLQNFTEVPMFLDSQASRLIQLADLVAYAIFRKFEKDDDQFYSIIEGCFDSHAGNRHGLHLLLPNQLPL